MKRRIYLLNNEKYDGAENFAVTKIKKLQPKFAPKFYDALVFTSKNAVFSLDEIYETWRSIPAFSIGEGTSKAIRELGGNVVYEAKNAYGDEFAKELIPLLKNKIVLFPRAKKVVSNVGGILKNAGVETDELVVYESVCENIEAKKFEKGSIFIFTAPSVVRCFLKQICWETNFTAVAIGKKTAAAFPKDIKPYISPKQSVAECLSFAKTLSENNI